MVEHMTYIGWSSRPEMIFNTILNGDFARYLKRAATTFITGKTAF
jgi:hypothetical protein